MCISRNCDRCFNFYYYGFLFQHRYKQVKQILNLFCQQISILFLIQFGYIIYDFIQPIFFFLIGLWNYECQFFIFYACLHIGINSVSISFALLVSCHRITHYLVNVGSFSIFFRITLYSFLVFIITCVKNRHFGIEVLFFNFISI